jgi:hypothetical protein
MEKSREIHWVCLSSWERNSAPEELSMCIRKQSARYISTKYDICPLEINPAKIFFLGTEQGLNVAHKKLWHCFMQI